ncbi:MAG: hypothetical protein LBH41_00345 [Rickettsiales bacterium]|jgi:hypothetical protein|nr:hypothetical protein [Rickettsiales bacterium]
MESKRRALDISAKKHYITITLNKRRPAMKIVQFVKSLIGSSGVKANSPEHKLFFEAYDIFHEAEKSSLNLERIGNITRSIDLLLAQALSIKPQSPAISALIEMLKALKQTLNNLKTMMKNANKKARDANGKSPAQNKKERKARARARRGKNRIGRILDRADAKSTGQRKVPVISRGADGRRIARILPARRAAWQKRIIREQDAPSLQGRARGQDGRSLQKRIRGQDGRSLRASSIETRGQDGQNAHKTNGRNYQAYMRREAAKKLESILNERDTKEHAA